ncbi:Rv3212 family protein [Gordonia soli]|uniref:Uncharacterized protein n=1 Tax=Gordonia soli NBRC 108243 TaxID=1223545 RepID=M0QE58_9ACTN|nr:hypothetical protein [Gordonia soli]GAC66621.1 hypothetical protein GS4_03_00690 [Gordonia soli NBRC 108243]
MPRIRPERRTRLDLVISLAIVIAVAVVGVLVWFESPARRTVSTPAAQAAPDVDVAGSVPTTFVPAWQAHSPLTHVPAVGRSVVVTGDGGTVTGHDPATGREIWTYRRDLPLCALAAAWPATADDTLAVYRNSRGCGEVTALQGDDGMRVGTRSSEADHDVDIVTDSGYVLSQGATRLETWGSNLVRGIEYGRVEAPVKPGVQPGRTDCRLLSTGLGGDRVAVVERCAGDAGYRLTVLGAVLDKDEKVQQYGSSLITSTADGPPPRVVAVTNSAIAVYDGGTDVDAITGARGRPAIRQYSLDGAPTATNTVDGPAGAPADSFPLTKDGLTSFFTGRATVVLDAASARPVYQVPDTLGPGEVMAGQLLLPSRSGISVRDSATGREVRAIAVPREGVGDTTVSLRVIGRLVVQQWGPTVQTLRGD